MKLKLLTSDINNKLSTHDVFKNLLPFINGTLYKPEKEYQSKFNMLSKKITSFFDKFIKKTNVSPSEYYLYSDGTLELVFGNTLGANAHALFLKFGLEAGYKSFTYDVSLQIGDGVGRFTHSKELYPFLDVFKYNQISYEMIEYMEKEIFKINKTKDKIISEFNKSLITLNNSPLNNIIDKKCISAFKTLFLINSIIKNSSISWNFNGHTTSNLNIDYINEIYTISSENSIKFYQNTAIINDIDNIEIKKFDNLFDDLVLSDFLDYLHNNSFLEVYNVLA